MSYFADLHSYLYRGKKVTKCLLFSNVGAQENSAWNQKSHKKSGEQKKNREY